MCIRACVARGRGATNLAVVLKYLCESGPRKATLAVAVLMPACDGASPFEPKGQSMMRDLSRRFAALAVIGAFACATAPEPAAAALIGLVTRVKSSAYGTPPGSEREKKVRRFPIVQDELLETGAGAGMLVEFMDETILTLGEDSSLVIDTFVYDPASANVYRQPAVPGCLPRLLYQHGV